VASKCYGAGEERGEQRLPYKTKISFGTLAKHYRLTTSNEFKRVFQKGKAFREKGIFLKIRTGEAETSRIGIIVSKKVAKKATERNRIRRLLAEAIRKNLNEIKTGRDIVVVALPGFKEKKTQDVEKIVHYLFKKAALLK